MIVPLIIRSLTRWSGGHGNGGAVLVYRAEGDMFLVLKLPQVYPWWNFGTRSSSPFLFSPWCLNNLGPSCAAHAHSTVINFSFSCSSLDRSFALWIIFHSVSTPTLTTLAMEVTVWANARVLTEPFIPVKTRNSCTFWKAEGRWWNSMLLWPRRSSCPEQHLRKEWYIKLWSVIHMKRLLRIMVLDIKVKLNSDTRSIWDCTKQLHNNFQIFLKLWLMMWIE